MDERALAKIAAAISNGSTPAIYPAGYGANTNRAQGPQQADLSTRKQKEVFGQCRLENGWNSVADFAGIDGARDHQRNQNPRVWYTMTRRARTLVLLAILCALVWGALIGQLLS